MPNSAKTVHYVIDCSEPIFSVDFSNLISYILPIFINEYYHLLFKLYTIIHLFISFKGLFYEFLFLYFASIKNYC